MRDNEQMARSVDDGSHMIEPKNAKEANASYHDRMYCYLWYEKTNPDECKFGERYVPAGKDPSKTFLDPSCGNGRFLLEILRRRLANGMDMADALRTIYGVDLMQHNVDACRDRLLGDRTDLRHIVERNIVRADGMAYDYTFDAA